VMNCESEVRTDLFDIALATLCTYGSRAPCRILCLFSSPRLFSAPGCRAANNSHYFSIHYRTPESVCASTFANGAAGLKRDHSLSKASLSETPDSHGPSFRTSAIRNSLFCLVSPQSDLTSHGGVFVTLAGQIARYPSGGPRNRSREFSTVGKGNLLNELPRLSLVTSLLVASEMDM